MGPDYMPVLEGLRVYNFNPDPCNRPDRIASCLTSPPNPCVIVLENVLPRSA